MRAAIVLAAGRSRRFGRRDKLFEVLRGRPLVLHAIRAALAAPAARVILVIGRGGARVRSLLAKRCVRGVELVRMRGPDAPFSASLRAGIAALRPVERDAFLFLGDMPDVDPAIASRLVRRSRPETPIARPRYRGNPGHPVLIGHIRELRIGNGDAGFRTVGAAIGWVAGGPGCVADVDSRAALARARRARPRR